MYKIWGSLAGILVYLECVYHISGFGLQQYHPVYMLTLAVVLSGIQTMVLGILGKRLKKPVYDFFLWMAVIWYSVQLVYLRIFKQPLLWDAIMQGSGDALSDYWREAIQGLLGAAWVLLFFLLPAVLLGILQHRSKKKLPSYKRRQWLVAGLGTVLGMAAALLTLETGKYLQSDYYEEYTEFYNPLGVAENMGVLPLLQRDTARNITQWAETWREAGKDTTNKTIEELYASGQEPEEAVSVKEDKEAEEAVSVKEDKELEEAASVKEDKEAEEAVSTKEDKDAEGAVSAKGDKSPEEAVSAKGDKNPEEVTVMEYEVVTKQENGGAGEERSHTFAIDTQKLHALAENEKQVWLADYIGQLQPTTTNAYTGMFAGYNLIYLTAEGFSTYAIREDLTPTLYRLAREGFVCTNYYVPLWQTSTSDGEYINCTGLIPDGQFSMRKSSENDMLYSLPHFFAQEGVYSYAYHNNSLSYYDRHKTHTNLGYDFKASKLGKLSEEEWGTQLFEMEHPDAWPASDWEMMQGTVAEYAQEERFHVYYMTVSGHMNYDFKGNAMSSKNRSLVEDTGLSEAARAYLACNIELDRALEYLIEELDKAGQLEKTVICMSADHYPYGLTEEQYEELAGKSLADNKEQYKNTLLLWNASMKEPVVVDKACGPMDILPTLLNLFGFSYDSRMYAGRDILSEEEGMVIFNDRSFVTDTLIYNRKGKSCTWLQDAEGRDKLPEAEREAYLAQKQKEVKDRYQFSAYVLQENYYADICQAIP